MRRLSNTIARLKDLPRLLPQSGGTYSRLSAFSSFGSNPGQLRAWTYVPQSADPGAPLVVVLHGCTQNAADYDESSGWSRLADQHGFVLLYPEQQRSNNPNLCFNWFSAHDVARGKGEALSIRQMVASVQARHGTDPRRVFVTVLSAGGAMAAAMLATYPDVFAGGAVIAGLPFGVAQSVPEAFDRMRGYGGPPVAKLSDLVRAASDHAGDWPTLSVWHGSADQTVDQSNAVALIEQWRALHGTAKTPSRTEVVQGYPRRAWCDSSGREVVEEYSIVGLAHGTPLDTHGSDHGEIAAPFMLEAGISSTRRIGAFWGIVPDQASDRRWAPPAGEPRADQPRPRVAEVPTWSGRAGIHKTIEDALRGAGLMK
jgi:poly(hydroxyalkanoate) depolymerase family esterase